METALGKGYKSKKSNYIKYFIVKGDSPPIQRTDKGRIYSCIFTMDKSPRPKYITSKYLYSKYHATLHL